MATSMNNTSSVGLGATACDVAPPVAEEPAPSKPVQRIPDCVFEDISRNLEATLQRKEWANRPRTWYILNQIGRLDLMDAFILQGLNDTSIPYKGRQSLPENLNRFEYESFLEEQEFVQSDILLLEKGSHVRLDNGDSLFERRRVQLGVGSQGSSRVDRVTSKMTGKVYARKIINKSKRFGYAKEAMRTYENEIKTLRRQELEKNDHLIKIRGTYTDKKNLAMLLEPVADGDLKQHMVGNSIASEAERQRFRTYFGCLAHTIGFLHDHEILHKDIKPENVLLKNGHLILTDFGTAFDWSQTNQSMTRSNAEDRRTPRYQSPEVAGAGEFHRASDIWSLGVLFLEMTTILRGRSLAEMDEFIQGHGTGRMHAYDNLEGVIKWRDPLHTVHHGSFLDNEALKWVSQMLNHQQHLRPTAGMLHDSIVTFADGRYCGKCCSDEASDSEDSEMTSETGTVTPSSIVDQPLVERSDQYTSMPQLRPYEILTNLTTPEGGNQDQIMQNTKRKRSKSRKNKLVASRGVSSWMQPQQTASSGSTHPEIPVNGQKASHKRKVSTTNGAMSFPGKEAIVQWLVASAKRLKYPGPSRRRRREPKKRHYTVEAQQIGHFLSTLPEQLGDYENVNETSLGDRGISDTAVYLPKRSQSYDHFESAIEPLEIEEDYNAIENLSKHIHYASDSHLPLTPIQSEEDRQQSFKSLQAFAAQTPKLVPRHSFDPAFSRPKSKNAYHASEANLSNSLSARELLEHFRGKPRQASSKRGQTTSQIPFGLDLAELPRPGVEPWNRRIEPRNDISKKSTRLGEWIDGKNVGYRQNRFESATVIMEKILKTKTAEAPTTIMSARSRGIFSKGHGMTRYNDEYYGYLPYYVGQGKAQTVRCLLAAGCNPGTVSKPRPNLIFKAVRRASDQHNKCLRALVEYGADINYKLSSNGRTPIHYAIEQKLWSGYSTVIYVLLAARANPNAKDKAGDVPILMLLSGEGPLPPQRRDALFLLLAPNFNTSLDVTLQGSLENPLHLVICRKDAYAVDAILDKMKRDGETGMHLLHERNERGFTALLLAIFSFRFNEDASEELHIVKLLLECKANPDDQSLRRRNTCLYQVVKHSKSAVALELLCRHNADPKVGNVEGITPLDQIEIFLNENADDAWAMFAKRRMTNQLKDDDYKPPELTLYLKEEDNASK